jgi:TolB-like protein/Tfp pilus assembly protein PilF
MRLFVEVQRRGILKVATGYLIVSWLVLEVGHTLFNVFELPHAGLQFVFVLLALGFPIALLGAWQGWFGTIVQRDPHAAAGSGGGHVGVSHHEGPWLAAVFGVVALFAVAVAIGVRFFGMGYSASHGEHDSAAQASAASTATKATAEPPLLAPAAVNEKSIAVLPFTDMSEKKDQEYFGDGMAEEILALLAKIPRLTVIGRTSSFQFKGRNEDLRTIGAKLNAAHVLEGSVRKSGDHVRITAQLINTRTGTHEWSETYDRLIGDVLKLQDAIAAAVVRELQLEMASDYLSSRDTLKSADVYDLILRGRHAADRWDKEGLDEAATLFRQAFDRDPTSADAAAALALTYETQSEGGFAPPSAFERARRVAATALKLDPKNAVAHYVLGLISLIYDWDWGAAEREFQQVATLAPSSADALRGEAMLSRTLGRWDEALRQVKAALVQDPLDPGGFFILTKIQWSRGHLAEAEAAARRALEIRPTTVWAHSYLGIVLLARGDPDAALLEMQQETSEEAQQGGLAMAYHALGRKADSDAALARMLKEQADRNAFGIAEVYAFRGESDEAMHWLERAYVQKEPVYLVTADLPLKSLAADTRFEAFLRKMNLPE